MRYDYALVPKKKRRGVAPPAFPSVAFRATSNDITNLITYTFSGVNIQGEDNSNRLVVVVTHALPSTGGAKNVVSLTIGGIAADLVVENNNSAFVGDMPTAIFAKRVPVSLGNTADIVITYNDTMNICAIGVFVISNILNTTAFGTAIADDASSASLAVPNGGVVIAGCVSGTVAAMTWTGVTEQYDTTIAGSCAIGGGSFIYGAGGSSITIDASPGDQTQACASWR